jgi:hypothetical protein
MYLIAYLEFNIILVSMSMALCDYESILKDERFLEFKDK